MEATAATITPLRKRKQRNMDSPSSSPYGERKSGKEVMREKGREREKEKDLLKKSRLVPSSLHVGSPMRGTERKEREKEGEGERENAEGNQFEGTPNKKKRRKSVKETKEERKEEEEKVEEGGEEGKVIESLSLAPHTPSPSRSPGRFSSFLLHSPFKNSVKFDANSLPLRLEDHPSPSPSPS